MGVGGGITQEDDPWLTEAGVPMPSGNWDKQPCSAPTQGCVDAVIALTMLRDRIPLLVRELNQVHIRQISQRA